MQRQSGIFLPIAVVGMAFIAVLFALSSFQERPTTSRAQNSYPEMTQSAYAPPPTQYIWSTSAATNTPQPTSSAETTSVTDNTPVPSNTPESGVTPQPDAGITGVPTTESAATVSPTPVSTPLPAATTAIPSETPLPSTTPIPNVLACPSNTTILIEGSAPPFTPLILTFGGRPVGGGISNNRGDYRLFLDVGRDRPGEYVVQVLIRYNRLIVRSLRCQVDVGPTATITETPTTTP